MKLNFLSLILLAAGILHVSDALPSDIQNEEITINNWAKPEDLSNIRIIGGSLAEPQEFPQIAYLRSRTGHQFCSSTILSKDFVLTATHCMVYKQEDFVVVAGAHNYSNPNGYEQISNVSQIINYPGYISLPAEHDITILKVFPPFKLNKYVAAVTLPSDHYAPQEGDQVTAIGWGNTVYDPNSGSSVGSDTLKKVALDIVDVNRCGIMYRPVQWQGGVRSKITVNMVCAAGKAEGNGICQGDSGGPLLCKVKNSQVLCGISSFLAGCGYRAYPGVFTNVGNYLDFIKTFAK